jgi:FkbM family methyltransferase
MKGSVIYDFGMNNGDDIEYYLKKGLKVVGVEANPELVAFCRERFAKEVTAGDLVIENVAISDDPAKGSVKFFVHKSGIESSLIKPENMQKYEEISVQQKCANQIIESYGPAHYIKIDLEHYDSRILQTLLSTDIRPTYISAESHKPEVFYLLWLMGYKYFNIVDGKSVATKYRNVSIGTHSGTETFSFKNHSAGPFGEDIETPWMPGETFSKYLMILGMGWRDIHATNQVPEGAKIVNSIDQLSMRYLLLSPRQHISQIKIGLKSAIMLVPSLIRRISDK